jgi:peptidoglycan/xylan/chitin deacetylase (PgdA/CDA1 family)
MAGCETLACGGSLTCDDLRTDFMDAVLALLNELWIPASAAAAPGLAADDPDVISEIAAIVRDNWDTLITGSETVTIGSLYDDYYACVVSSCGWSAE